MFLAVRAVFYLFRMQFKIYGVLYAFLAQMLNCIQTLCPYFETRILTIEVAYQKRSHDGNLHPFGFIVKLIKYWVTLLHPYTSQGQHFLHNFTFAVSGYKYIYIFPMDLSYYAE